MCEICSELPEQNRVSDVFIVNFEHIYKLFWCFRC